MKKNHYHILASILFIFSSINNLKSQIRDHWPQVYGNPNSGSTTMRTTKSTIEAQNAIYYFGSEVISATVSSFISKFDPNTGQNNHLTYTQKYNDGGINCALTVNTSTANTSYLFFGTNVSSENSPKGYPTIYKYNTLNSQFSEDSLVYGNNDLHVGILNIANFNDTLRVFAKYDDTIKVFKKQITANGYILSSKTDLLTDIYGSIVFQNKLYVYGDSNSCERIITSNDGINFSRIPSFDNMSIYSNSITHMEVFNNELYYVHKNASNTIVETSINKLVGTTKIPVLSNLNDTYITSLKGYKNKLWFSYGLDLNFFMRPSVNYISMPSNSNTLSIDSIGGRGNKGENFFMNVVNDSLYFGGDYNYNGDVGAYIYKLQNPRATLTNTATSACLNTTITFTASCLNTDSIHFLLNNVYQSTIAGNYTEIMQNFNVAGNQTITIVAHAGTLKDSATTTVTIFNFAQTPTSNQVICQGSSKTLNTTINGGTAPYTYNWSPNINLSSQTTSATIASPTTTTIYSIIVQDVNGCSNTATVSVNVIPSKNITGTIAPISGLSTGTLSLYKYDTQLSLWEEIQSKPYTTSYSFNTIDSAKYVIRATPSENTLQVTYSPSSISWQNALIINHGCAANTTQSISINSLTNIGSGTGSMSGLILEGDSFGQRLANQPSAMAPLAPGSPIGGITVKGGKNPGGNMFTQTKTDASGGFTLTGIPNTVAGESIFIFIDIPGLDTAGTYYRGFNTGESYTNLNFTVDSAKIRPVGVVDVGINQLAKNNIHVTIFPNPAKNYITVNSYLDTESHVNIEIVDVLGQLVKKIEDNNLSKNTNYSKKIDLSDMNNGLYYINTSINGIKKTNKIIVNK